ncbi:MAG TPA: hypothetical protein VER96_09465 [Polyangiaceae bacterium]|nr:hypothetical protein [Polyangiaceae bacterium]
MGGFKWTFAGALLLAGCSSSGTEPSQSIDTKGEALTTSLAARSGALCFVERTGGFHRNIGFAEPGADGFVDSALAQGEAVLGGTNTSTGYRLAQTDVEFEVTDMRAAWDDAAHGPRQQVCAEVSVRNACNLERACWHADGGWSLERKSNPGMTTLSDCGNNGETIVAQDSGASERAEPLLVGNRYTLHVDVAQGSTQPQISAVFKKGSNARVVQRAWTAPLAGFSGMRHDRMGIRSRVSGQKPMAYSEPLTASCQDCQSTLSALVQGDAQGSSGPLSCTYEGAFSPPEALRLTTQTCRGPMKNSLAWAPPAGISASDISGYSVFRDGLAQNLTAIPSTTWDDRLNLLPSQIYTYQVGWRDAAGKLRDLATLAVTTPEACKPEAFDDGVHHVGAVLMRFRDAPLPREPYSLAAAREAFSTSPNSATAFIHEVSRGTATLDIQTYGWIDLPYAARDYCSDTYDPPGGGTLGYGYCGPSVSNPNEIGYFEFDSFARQNGVPIDSFENVIYVLHGLANRGAAGYGRIDMGTATGNIDTSALVHEMGHLYGLQHAFSWDCDSASTISPGADLFDPGSNGCEAWAYGDTSDTMGTGPHHYNTVNLLRLGWLSGAETAVAEIGQSYWLGKLNSTTYPLRQLRVPLDHPASYFLEYRAAEGFDALSPCSTCNPQTGGTTSPVQGVTIRTVPGSWTFRGVSQLDAGTMVVNDPPLRGGQSWYDRYRKLTVRVLEENSEGAKVEVVWDGSATAPVANCQDGAKNGTETDVDCGGSCAGCLEGRACLAASDCQSGDCRSGSCYLPPVDVKAGGNFACAQFSDGSVRCWGRNDRGQLGVSSQATPVGDQPGEMGLSLRRVPLSGPAQSFALGDGHGCAVLQGGAVECWGKNSNGQLGAGDTTDRVGVVVRANLPANANSVSLGDDFSCALSNDGKVRCWGSNFSGQLGRGSRDDIGDGPNEMGSALWPINIPGLPTQIAAGSNHVCAVVLNDNFQNELRCWGDNGSGQLGLGATGSFGDSAAELVPPAILLGTGFRPSAVAAGAYHSCAVNNTGALKCWGSAMFGETGYGDTKTRGRTTATMGDALLTVPLGRAVAAVQAHQLSTCVVFNDATNVCWGFAGAAVGQPSFIDHFGVGDAPNEVSPSLPAIDLGPGFQTAAFAAGYTFNCALSTDRRLKCWGMNSYGELGAGDVLSRGAAANELGANLPFVSLP